MKFKYYIADGTAKGEKEFNNVPEFEGDKGVRALKDLVVAYQASLRQGNACTKTRDEVSGTGKKPWRQKGTGMARHGSKRSPIWRGGGVVFGPRPRDYTQKMNKKVKLLGLRRAFWDSATEGSVAVIESLSVAEPKTKAFVSILKNIQPKPHGNVLLVDEYFEDNAILSARNVPNVFMIGSESLNAWDLVRFKKVIITERAMNKFLERIND